LSDILKTISQPKALSFHVPVSRKEVYLFYNSVINLTTIHHASHDTGKRKWSGIFDFMNSEIGLKTYA